MLDETRKLPIYNKGQTISSRSPDQIQDYINGVKNCDERTLQTLNSTITDTLITSQKLANTDIHDVKMGMEVSIKSIPLTSYHLIYPIKGNIFSHNLNDVILQNDLLIVPPDCPTNVTWNYLSEAIVITLDPASLRTYFDITSEFATSGKATKLTNKTTNATAVTNLINYIHSIYRESPLLMQSKNSQENFEKLLFEAVALTVPELGKANEIQILPYIVKKVTEYIEENIHNNIKMSDLVSISGVSRRSLETNFNKAYQISPMKFITNRKLELVRDILTKSRPEEASVIEISERFNFQHASHFSMLYQRRYSEKPSETLRYKHKKTE